MTINKKGASAAAAGLAMLASLFAYAPRAEARTCQNTSPNWTTSVTCPGTEPTAIFGKAWGTTTTKIGGIPFRIKSLYAYYFGSGVGFAGAQALDSAGRGIANCKIIDYSPSDLYPEGTSHSACQNGARVFLSVSY